MDDAANEMVEDAVTKPKPVFGLWRCFWLTFLVVSLAYAWYCFYTPANNIAWAENYPTALKQSVESEKEVVVYFTGTWCVPCRIMKRQVLADPEVAAKVNSEFIAVTVDVGEPDNAELMEAYQVKGPPVMIVVDSAGNALRWKAGGMGKQEFLALLNGEE